MSDSIQKAQALYQNASFAEASALYASILEIQPKAQLYYEHALCLLRINEKRHALLQLDKALDLDPDNPFRYASRAYVKDALGDTKGAIEDYKACIRIDPEDAIAHNNLGLLYDKLGRKEAAQHHVKQADMLAGAHEYLEKQRNQAYFDKQQPEEVKRDEKKSGNILSEMFNALKDKKSRSEFFTFVRKGWKL